MMKIWQHNGRTFQCEEGEQPEGAVELKKAAEPSAKPAEVKTEEKAVKPANKARKVKMK